MRKEEFLAQLRKGLAGLPQADIEERLTFYSEMIADQMEEGIPEEEAVAAAGPVDEIVAQAVADTPLTKLAKERMKPKRQLAAWEILLLVIGAPIWFSLGIAVLSVVISLYVSLWSVVISLWAVFVSLAACAVGFSVGCILIIGRNIPSAIAVLAAGLVCAGVSIFACYGCTAATKGTLFLTKKIALGFKNCFIRKGEVQ